MASAFKRKEERKTRKISVDILESISRKLKEYAAFTGENAGTIASTLLEAALLKEFAANEEFSKAPKEVKSKAVAA